MNDKFKTKRATANTTKRNNTNKAQREFKKEVTLTGQDSTYTLRHGLNTRRLIVTVKDADKDRIYAMKIKKVDANTISFQSTDSVRLSITVKADKPFDDEGWYKGLQVTSRILMMVRSVQMGYKQTRDTYLPYFQSDIGDFYGQGNSESGLVPGLGFAFGFEGGESFTRKAQANHWLIMNDSLTSPAVYNLTKDLSYSATLEPWTGLKVTLTGTWKNNQQESHQFMSSGLPIQRSGSFQMTTIAIGSSFGGHDAGDSYSSKVFDEFIANRQVIYDRLLSRYEGTKYPTGGFMKTIEKGDMLAGQPYNKNLGASRINTSDVLVPAFFAAYVGGDASSVSLDPIPSMWKLLPNWRITYDGLLQLFPKLTKWLKSLQLSHAYNCTYAIGNYQSYTNFLTNEQGLGFVLDVANDCPVPSSEFDIGTVTLNESFQPLIGLNATLNNGLSLKSEYAHIRSVSLAMSSAQITENVSKNFTLGMGYKIADFNTKIGLKSGKQKDVKHDLNMKFDITHKSQMSLLRKINDAFSQATSGNSAWTFKFSADYQLSKALQFKLYYDRQVNTPLISTSYPTVNSDFGMTLSFSLTR